MTLRFLLVYCCMLISVHVTAQVTYSLGDETSYIEGLKKEVESSGNDSIKASTYLNISLLYRRINDLEKAKDYLEKGQALSSHSPFLKASSAYVQALMGFSTGDIPTLEKNLRKADSLLTPFHHPEAYRVRATIWNNLGIIQQVKGSEKDAMSAFINQAIPLARQSGDAVVQGKTHKAIAIIFMNANQRKEAADYLQQAIDAFTQSTPDNPVHLVELTEAYIIASENHTQSGSYDSAATELNTARTFLRPYPSSNLYLLYYFAEGTLYDKRKRYPQAIESFDKGIATANKFAAAYSLNRLRYAKYKSLSNNKDYNQAVVVLTELLQDPRVFTQDKKLYYKELYKTYAKLGKPAEALLWAERYLTLSDSLHESKSLKDIIELEKKYKEAENQKMIATLEAEQQKTSLEAQNTKLMNSLLVAISTFLLITVLFALIVYRNSKKIAHQKEVQYQQELKETEQKQHLQVTKALMQGEEKERHRLAIDLHDGLGGRLAGIKINLSQLPQNDDVTKILQQLDVSSNELRRIARNLMPESLLQLGLKSALQDMCDSLSSPQTQVIFQDFTISATIPQETQVNIYRIVQELLTNAIRHAQASEILVQCSQNQSMFFITLEDNGKGFDIVNDPKKDGIGLNNVEKRIEYLKGKLDILSAPGEGTTINIEFDVNT